MHHKGAGDQPGQRGERREREEGEAAGIVGIVDGILPVDPGPVEVLEVLDEVDLRSLDRPGHAEDPGLLRPVAQWHQEGRADRLEIRRLVADGPVEREDGRDVESRGPLERGKPAHRLGHAADAGEGRVLRRHVHDGNRLAARRQQRRRDTRRHPGRLASSGHPRDLMPWAGRRPTTPPEWPEHSIPGRIPAPCAGR